MTEHNTTGPRPEESLELFRVESPDVPEPTGHDDCEYAPRVSAYHDGEVPESEARALTRHLAGCQACAAQLAFFGRVTSTFEAAPMPRLDSDARNRLNGLGNRIQGEQSGRLRIKPSADVRWVRRLTAAAAILFVVAAGKVIYEQKFAGHDNRNLIPAVSPHDPVAPAPEPVSQDHAGGTGQASPDSRGPAVTDTGFVVERPTSAPPTTGQTTHP